MDFSRPPGSPDVTAAEHARTPWRSPPRLESVIDGLDAIVWEAVGRTLQFTFVSRPAERMLGHPVASWLADPDFWTRHLHPDDREAALESRRDAVRQGLAHALEYRLRAADGRFVWLRDVASVERHPDGATRLRGVLVEISSRRSAEEHLTALVTGTANTAGRGFFLELTRLLAEALEMEYAFVGELVRDAPARMRTLAAWGQDRFLPDFEYDTAGTPCEHVVVRGSMCVFPRDLRRLFPGNALLEQLGAESYIGTPLCDSAGRVAGHVCVLGRRPLVDAERARSLLKIFALRAAMELERQRTEDALRRSEARYRALFETAAVALWEFDLSDLLPLLDELPATERADPRAWLAAHPEFERRAALALRPIGVNEAAVRLLGATSREELLRIGPEPLFTAETRVAFRDAVAALLAGRPRLETTTRARTLDGRMLDFWLTISFPPAAAALTHVPVSLLDLTALRRAERAAWQAQEAMLEQQRAERARVETELGRVRDELVRSTRLSVIGQVAASIAHDLRNPLGAIRNASYFLQRRAADPKSLEHLAIIEREVMASDRLLDNLLDLARVQPPVKEAVDLAVALRQALEATPGADAVELRVALDPAPFLVDADPMQLRRLLVNLFCNSVQAMEGRGGISVTAVHAVGEDRIAVVDDGPGVPVEDRERIFEPLFTTRARGSGLGLATCRQVVERHGGSIALARGEGPGARFEIRLPRRGG